MTSTWSACPLPQDEGSACQAFHYEGGDSDEEEKREEGKDDKAPLPPEMVAAKFEDTKPELISDDGYAQVSPGKIAALIEGRGDE